MYKNVLKTNNHLTHLVCNYYLIPFQLSTETKKTKQLKIEKILFLILICRPLNVKRYITPQVTYMQNYFCHIRIDISYVKYGVVLKECSICL